ncbi:hypothetical protein K4F52_009051 [Lecanicillium sp. MT-2017a]|nr:hypothetical protein K4F52_009051 [Lecanicillium sp. MT-2017a]
MRTTRIIILLVFLTATLFILFRAVTSPTPAAGGARSTPGNSRKSILGFVYYNPPFSLFPPNAAISLTDDNSTSFAARPAAFGPKLAPTGLSGRLWVGSGFVEDSFESHGEFGCSDIPGWDGGNAIGTPGASIKGSRRTRLPSGSTKKKANTIDAAIKADDAEDEPDTRTGLRAGRIVDDGTDNHFHIRSAGSLSRRDSPASSSHADIQSMQESAEIQGKVVLLMRGGCGFLEKVMWAQRRGAIAVIVGDNQRGGPLIQMFARGEEIENVTIPSVFTARTTAQLLSSLTQPGSFIEDSLDDSGNPVLKVQRSGSSRAKNGNHDKTVPEKASSSAKDRRSPKQRKQREEELDTQPFDNRGWFSRLFHLGKSPRSVNADSRSPSSGRLDWVVVDEWNDEKDKLIIDGMKSTKKQPHKSAKQSADNFIIGVQDWRDPDLIEKSRPGSSRADRNAQGDKSKKADEIDPKKATSLKSADNTEQSSKGHGILSKIFGDDDDTDDDTAVSSMTEDDDESHSPPSSGQPVAEPHEGLWVTIIPTSGATPFFDTLLVLVVSPLVTLSVVYALLILRARIRRRRWRAPKSVVERLPVRTYHTVATSPSTTPGTSTPSSSSPTTPLLQHSSSRPRPRSRTTTGIPESEVLTTPTPAIPTSSAGARGTARNEHEKGSSSFSAEWRKYMGRQVECVVCLEEYVDGYSLVNYSTTNMPHL